MPLIGSGVYRMPLKGSPLVAAPDESGGLTSVKPSEAKEESRGHTTHQTGPGCQAPEHLACLHKTHPVYILEAAFPACPLSLAS